MSEAAVFFALGSTLATATVAAVLPNVGRSTVKRVFDDPPESVAPADFPCIVLFKDPTATHLIQMDSVGGARHVYQVLAYLLLGIASTPLPELHKMAKPWGEALALKLNAARSLGAVCLGAWGMGGDTLASYTGAQISFTENANYWGLRFQFTITELID
jgi:hypothetical protein